MPRRDRAKEKYWRRLLRQWRASGLSGRDFCRAQRLSEPSFYAWRREIARRDQQRRERQPALASHAPAATPTVAPQQSTDLATPAFVKLSIVAGTTPPPAIEVVVAERRVLRVRPGFDADLLRQLVRLLEEPSC